MYYYEVWVASQRYRSNKSLTYAYSEQLQRGTIVLVPLQKEKVLGIVDKPVQKPKITTKDIVRVISEHAIPQPLYQLLMWLQVYYPAPPATVLMAALPSTLIQAARKSVDVRTPTNKIKTKPLPTLTDEQQSVVTTAQKTEASTVLLHGATGSGKTRVYLELVGHALQQSKSSIILTPEIGLTPQLENTVRSAFSEHSVFVLHSMLTNAQRRDIWLHIHHSTSPVIVIGTRSALFAPVKDLGLIVMDEAHDQAYKQEQAPHYHASRVAAKLATLSGAKLIMGSATPPVSDHYAVTQKNLPVLHMRASAITHNHEAYITTVKLEQRENFTKSPYISNQLIEAIMNAINRKEQSLVFLNRRGTARIVLCQQCGWQALCPNCDITLTYHADAHAMHCHTCGHRSNAPSSCPSCKHPDITFRSIGTKYLVNELQRIFPAARIQRFDTDSTKSERLEQHYDRIKQGDVDILVGTQLLSKGLDLPKLSTVGVVIADTSLFMPDFTAHEVTFQQLTQIMGRVGRGHTASHVIVQSYHPENPAIQAALTRDYDTFYTSEITERRNYNFPPFCYLLKLQCGRASVSGAEKASTKLAQIIKDNHKSVEVIGPTPAFHERVAGKYRWQIILKANNRTDLLNVIDDLPANWSYDIDPVNLL
jgi:primosomal protein N' (replication factor Y) (superfamily II helicase)